MRNARRRFLSLNDAVQEYIPKSFVVRSKYLSRLDVSLEAISQSPSRDSLASAVAFAASDFVHVSKERAPKPICRRM
jgi:hypothetical protein